VQQILSIYHSLICKIYKGIPLIVLSFFLCNTIYAQRIVTGSVTTAENGNPLPGVNIAVSGHSIGTVSDMSGFYELEIPDGDIILVFSFVGMKPISVEVGNQSVIDIEMASDIQQLSEIVVTSLGITKEKKSLGYAVQKLPGESLSDVKDGNIVNSFAGKIAGVQVTGNSGTVGGSSRIILRGINSLSGNNQPLFIVDGTPVDNSNYNDYRTQLGNGGNDYGNAGMDINPDDVESVTVLKGANAAALYGSRAGNGVIMITTKKGSKRKGIGVTFSTGVSVKKPAVLPDYQNEYGGGYKQSFDLYNGEPVVNYNADESWGPKMEGQMVRQWYSWFPDDPDYGQLTPFLPHPDNIKDFYETGIITNNNISLEGGNENTRFRLGYTNYRESGIMPNDQLKRNSIALVASSDLTDGLTISTNINFVNTNHDGIPGSGYSPRQGNVVTSYNQWFQRQLDMNKLKNYKTADGRQRPWNIISPTNLNPAWWDNPYWVLYESPQNMKRQRVFGNVSLAYEFTKGLTLQGWYRTDYYQDRREERVASNSWEIDYYGKWIISSREDNFEILLQYNTVLGNDWNLSANLGANSRRNTRNFDGGNTVGGLNVPNFFNLQASNDRPDIIDYYSEKVVNSVYGSLNLGYKGMLFLDGSLRNDWSSTLPEKNNSYLYPSISGTWLFSELLNSQFFSLGKIRVSWAQVGNDTDPYQLNITYSSDPNYGNLPVYRLPNTIPNAELKPERITTKELGVELGFFNNRLEFDVTYYSISSINQILPLDVTATNGYHFAMINAGEMTNKGWEVMFNSRVIESAGGFNWDFGINWARNVNEVVKLAEGQTNYRIGGAWGASINAKIGQPYGTWTTVGFEYNEKGERIVDANGYFKWVLNQDFGSYLPDWTGGIINTFTYKGITLYALIDFQKGGQVYSVSNGFGDYTGLTIVTAGNNDKGNPQRDDPADGGGWRADGVFEDGEPNNIYIESIEYWKYAIMPEYYLYDASYLKLRELRIAYLFPRKISGPFTNIELSFISRNLAILYKNIPNVDPETAYGSDNIQGFENGQHPSTRIFGFNLKLGL